MKGELIGRKAQGLYAGKKFSGTIIDETKNTIKIETSDKIKIIIKNEAMFKIDDKVVEGKKISKRPEDRIKAC